MAVGALMLGIGLGGTASAAPPKPEVGCAYGHVCGWDAYGASFDFVRCDVENLRYMRGTGTLINNQWTGTESILWADSMGSVYAYSYAYDWRTLNWDNVAWITVC